MTEIVRFAPVEFRSAAPGFVVGLVVPYDEITYRTEHPDGERFVGGAFGYDEVATYAGRRYPVVLDHDPRFRVGTIVHLAEVRQGLLAGIRFDQDGETARRAAEIAASGPIGLSVGFYTLQTARGDLGERVVVSARLDHVSIVPDPAYASAKSFVQAAPVVGIRSSALTAVRWHTPPWAGARFVR